MLAQVVRSGLLQATKVPRGNLGNSDGILAIGSVLYLECDGVGVLLGVGGAMAVRWVYRLEAEKYVSFDSPRIATL